MIIIILIYYYYYSVPLVTRLLLILLALNTPFWQFFLELSACTISLRSMTGSLTAVFCIHLQDTALPYARA